MTQNFINNIVQKCEMYTRCNDDVINIPNNITDKESFISQLRYTLKYKVSYITISGSNFYHILKYIYDNKLHKEILKKLNITQDLSDIDAMELLYVINMNGFHSIFDEKDTFKISCLPIDDLRQIISQGNFLDDWINCKYHILLYLILTRNDKIKNDNGFFIMSYSNHNSFFSDENILDNLRKNYTLDQALQLCCFRYSGKSNISLYQNIYYLRNNVLFGYMLSLVDGFDREKLLPKVYTECPQFPLEIVKIITSYASSNADVLGEQLGMLFPETSDECSKYYYMTNLLDRYEFCDNGGLPDELFNVYLNILDSDDQKLVMKFYVRDMEKCSDRQLLAISREPNIGLGRHSLINKIGIKIKRVTSGKYVDNRS